MILLVKAPRHLPVSADHDTDEPTAAVEAMIAELGRLRQRTGDRALLGAYQAAIDRLEALAYRLENDGTTRIIGLPAKRLAAPKAAGGGPQRALPLGPVVVARKPKRP